MPSLAPAEQPLSNCNGFITHETVRKNGWITFHEGHVLRIDLTNSLLAVDLRGQHYAIYFNGGTQICREGKPATIRDVEVGDQVGGYTKVIQGQSVAVELGFGPKSPYLVARPDRRAQGYFYSPYAPDKPPFKITQVPADGLVKCPYTGKFLRVPPPPRNWTRHWTDD